MDWLLYPVRRIWRYLARRAFLKCLRDEVAEEFLEILLKLMSLSFCLDRNLRKNIEGFNGLIQFRSKDNEVRVLAEFKDNRLKAKELKPTEKLKATPNATVVFKNADALMNFLLPKGGGDGRRDILRPILENEVALEGNFNYIFRFGFLANHLQLKLL
ncbi:MAG: hypothetical protein QME81_05555 [bacterium]|nr:hypothetical protein [bacterium]